MEDIIIDIQTLDSEVHSGAIEQRELSNKLKGIVIRLEDIDIEQVFDYEKIALKLVFDAQARYKTIPSTAIKICTDKILFMMDHNPSPINPSKRKKEYHDYWDGVVAELIKMKSQL